MRVLAIGDLVGENGVKKLKETLPKIREQEKIDFNQSAKQVYNHVRGLNPWPGAYAVYQGYIFFC